ncbi:MAG: 4Fe-4S dicluster domain-containing protein [Gemmatimonadota bacterium]|nr:4Fe-4S dicluster domain-containing protein [Gemmatimonadota bacterium]
MRSRHMGPDSGRRPEAASQAASDREACFEVGDDFRRFSQKDDVFCRSFWDPEVRSDRSDMFYETYRTPRMTWRSADGFTQRDYALRNASWHVTDIFAELRADADRREGFLDPYTAVREGPGSAVEVASPQEMAREVKHAARTLGADLVGITGYDERWTYTHAYSRETETEKPQEVTGELENVVVIAQSMDRELLRTAPSALSGAATGATYSRDTIVLLAIAQYITNLGYRAVASMNDAALAIPLAIKAGLGEYGRHGLLITREFGPRVRLGKVFTDMPLAHDRPVRFGVREMCEVCRACTEACPARAIAGGEPSTHVHNRSNIQGIRKWTTDAEKCFRFWANQNTDCAICVRVCPYNRTYDNWPSRVWRWVSGTRLRRLALWLDRISGRGRRLAPRRWWNAARSRYL